MARYRNPWSNELIYRERAYFANNRAEMAGAYLEANYAEEMATETCGGCGGTAYYKSTIGTHKCPSCGAIRVSRVNQETGRVTDTWTWAGKGPLCANNCGRRVGGEGDICPICEENRG